MFIADLHIHSHFSRATSRDLTPELLDWWARRKGIQVVGTGDFTHPGWRQELAEKLIPAEEGLYRLRAGSSPSALWSRGKSARFINGTAGCARCTA